MVACDYYIKMKEVVIVDLLLKCFSIIAFFLSLYNFFKTIFDNRKKVDIDVKNIVFAGTSRCDIYTITIEFINNSTKPIVISRINILSNNNIIEANYYKELLGRSEKKTGGDIQQVTEYFSDPLPINLSGMQAQLGNYRFYYRNKENVLNLQNNYFKIELKTNRGIIRKEIHYDKPYSELISEMNYKYNRQ